MVSSSPRWSCWSVLQVIVIVVCYGWKVSSEIAQGCVESQLSLRCPEMKVISVTSVVLGDSLCPGTWCCIKDNDCTDRPNESHINDVHRRCNGQRSCTVDVLKEQIPCGYLSSWSYNDFERIRYSCRDDSSRNDTTTSTQDNSTNDYHEAVSSRAAHVGVEQSWVVPVMAIICLLVVIAIIAVVVMMMRRKRWPQVKYSVEMTDIDNSDRNEAIYANDNQTTNLNDGNGSLSPLYSKATPSKAKKAANKSAAASAAYETPNNAVYSFADDAGSTPTEDPNVYCDVDSREPAYEVPRPGLDIYSVVRDVEKTGHAGSAADESIDDGNVYSDVETREPAKAANSAAGNVYDEASNWNKGEYGATKTNEINPAQKKTSPSHTTAPDSHSRVRKPTKNAATFDPKPVFPGGVEAKGKVSTSDGFPSPTYETMSPGIPESIYANEPALSSPSGSLAAIAKAREGSETESPYCEMQSPPIRFKDDGSQTLVENDLYSH